MHEASGRPRPLPSPFTKGNTALYDLSSVPTPRRNGERSSSTKYACSDKGRHAPTYFARMKGTTISSVRTDAIPTPRCADKTAPPGGDDRYGDPPSKYGLTTRVYGPTHYGMGLMTMALTFKANQANEGLDPAAQDRGYRLHDQQRQPTTRWRLPTPSLSPQHPWENRRR
jgi:hypothetical protein